MTRTLYVLVVFCVLLGACTQRMVCPAYQSAFIYDKDQLRKKFSYFENDSSPKVYSASKTKYLIAEPTSYRKKTRTISTVPAKKVLVAVPDSISGKNSPDSLIAAELDLAARSVIDSTVFVEEPQADSVAVEEDSVYVISKDREVRVLKYNMPDSLEFDSLNNRYVRQKPQYYVDEVGFSTEQDNYMWYLRRTLVLPDVRIAKLKPEEGKETKDKSGKKKGPFAFFKNLFKKDKGQDIDSAELQVNPNQEEQFDFIDTTATESPDQVVEPKQKRKGLLKNKPAEEVDAVDTPTDPKRKKKKKKSKTPPEQPAVEQKKTEDEDDGF